MAKTPLIRIQMGDETLDLRDYRLISIEPVREETEIRFPFEGGQPQWRDFILRNRGKETTITLFRDTTGEHVVAKATGTDIRYKVLYDSRTDSFEESIALSGPIELM